MNIKVPSFQSHCIALPEFVVLANNQRRIVLDNRSRLDPSRQMSRCTAPRCVKNPRLPYLPRLTHTSTYKSVGHYFTKSAVLQLPVSALYLTPREW
jgi:hypothetical protein